MLSLIVRDYVFRTHSKILDVSFLLNVANYNYFR